MHIDIALPVFLHGRGVNHYCSGYMFEPRTVYKISNILLSTVNHYTAYTTTLIITTQECHYNHITCSYTTVPPL